MSILDPFGTGVVYFLIARAVVLTGEVLYLLYTKGRNSDALANIACGALVYLVMRFWQNASVVAMVLWLSNHAIWSFDSPWWIILIAIPVADLTYYVYHYTAHHIRFFWADHSVHHSSDEFDFTTSLRHSFLTGLYSWWPCIPLVLLGFPALPLLWARAFVNDYAFFVHTQYIPKLGCLEKVLNTPSHHRVHHARNPEYMDKNFGFLFIVWDRMFGTYAEEHAPCQFGIKHSPNSRNPLKIVFCEWRRMAQDVYRATRWRDKLRALAGETH